MTHKVHPKAFRIKYTDDWTSRGFYEKPAENLEEDFKIRSFLDKKFMKTGIEKVEIEKFSNKLNIIIFTSRPGIIIGRRGEGVEQLKQELSKKVLKFNFNKKEKTLPRSKGSANKKEKKHSSNQKISNKKELRIEIREVKKPWLSASLTAQWVAQQIEKRVNYRKVLKQAITKVSMNKEVKGVKIEVSGRLNGVEIARREWLRKGQLPLQTIRADIDYAKAIARCTYGVIGIKVWIYKGEKFD